MGQIYNLDITKYSIFWLSTSAASGNSIAISGTPTLGQTITIYFVNSTAGSGTTFASNAYSLPSNFLWEGQNWTQLTVNKCICVTFIYTYNGWMQQSKTGVYTD